MDKITLQKLIKKESVKIFEKYNKIYDKINPDVISYKFNLRGLQQEKLIIQVIHYILIYFWQKIICLIF